jgi:glycosyltransferase A (GT-A) superfamily protein (DUF2064 family)
MTQKAVLIFTKVPIPGFVKTRLAKDTSLSDKDVALIAEAMLKDTIVLSCKSDADRVELGFIPEDNFSKLESIIDSIKKDGYVTKSISYHLQEGSNFDEMFSSVVKKSFENNSDFLIVLGADLPYLGINIINYAFDQLSEANEKERMIMGPAGGGGIYLVGMTNSFDGNRFVEHSLFRGGVEISQFAKLCESEKIELILLPPFIDIDLEEDLVSLVSIINALEAAKTHKHLHFPKYTTEILRELGIFIDEIPGETRRRKIGKQKRD